MLGILACLSLNDALFAGSATWSANPTSNDWNTASNWTPETVPNGPGDVAIFATSTITAISTSAPVQLGRLVFAAGANAFNVTASGTGAFELSGAGVINSSGVTQNFVVSPRASLNFLNTSTAGVHTAYLVMGGTEADPEGNGLISFSDSANAGSALFTINAGEAGAMGGKVSFDGLTGARICSARRATFQVNGVTDSNPASQGGLLEFSDTTAAHATIIVSGGDGTASAPGTVIFSPIFSSSDSDAGDATIIANGGLNGGAGGLIQFRDYSTALGTRVILLGNGTLDLSAHDRYPGIEMGSIEGTGTVNMGYSSLTVGANNRSTTFSGVLAPLAGAKFSKTGSGTFQITKGPNWGMTIKEGTVLLTDRQAVNANIAIEGGTLGG